MSKIRVPLLSVVVHREGKSLKIPVGRSFRFTDDEYAQIQAADKNALRGALETDNEVDIQDLLGTATRSIPRPASVPDASVIPAQAQSGVPAKSEADLQAMKLADLKDMAKAMGIAGADSRNKDPLVDAILKAQAGIEPDSEDL